MNKISKYSDFLLEKEFNSIIDDIFRIVEDVDGKWTSPNTIEWDYSNEPKEETQENDKDELTDAIIDFGERALNISFSKRFLSSILEYKMGFIIY